MKPYLLDVNVLIALAWPNHVHHSEALEWFVQKGAAAFCTCPITQTGFVRISSATSFSPTAVTPIEALALLDQITDLPGHRFWPDDLTLSAVAASRPPIVSHRQVTDAYLLALAISHGGVMATLDRGVVSLARRDPESVEIVFAP